MFVALGGFCSFFVPVLSIKIILTDVLPKALSDLNPIYIYIAYPEEFSVEFFDQSKPCSGN